MNTKIEGGDYKGQTPLDIAGTAYGSLTAADVNHMWWTGDEDPQTVASRYAMATMVSGTGDKKNINPTPMDMRYLQSYSGGSLAAGETATFIVAILAGAGLANTQQAAANARKAYDWNWNLPKPPAAPQIAADGVSTNEGGTVDLTWSYSDAQIAAVDPDKGSADFAGFRIYKAATAPRQSSGDIMTAEGVSADAEGQSAVANGTPFTSASTGPYTMVLDIPAASVGDYGGNGTYTWNDTKVAIGLTYWYYVAAYDGNKFYKIKPHKMKVIESTGAGDAFASTFVSSLIKNKDIETALKSGLINAESVITHHGAKNKLLKSSELDRLLKRKRIKVKVY